MDTGRINLHKESMLEEEPNIYIIVAITLNS